MATMITFSQVRIPQDIVLEILKHGEISPTTFKTLKAVNTEFKFFFENKSLYQSLLIWKKGKIFSDPLYLKNPKNYLFLDHELTATFHSILNKNHLSNAPRLYKHLSVKHVLEKKKIQEKISRIVLTDLKLKVFTLVINDSEPLYFESSKLQIQKLKKVNIDNHDEWNKCLTSMATSIIKSDISNIQANFEFQDSALATKIYTRFLKPNAKMHALIECYKITGVFFISSNRLVIKTLTKAPTFSSLIEVI